MKAIIVPFKNPASGKTRLSRLLGPEQRRGLGAAMFADVTQALSKARRADAIFIVTDYAPACRKARELGFEVLVEESQRSESASVNWASRELERRGFDQVMRLPADIPLVTAEDVDALLELGDRSPAVVMVPSRDGTGTNAIVRTPPTLFPSHFGPDSLRLHSVEAARLGIRPLIVTNERIGLDIDEPLDLAALLQSEAETETLRFIHKTGIARAVIAAGGGRK